MTTRMTRESLDKILRARMIEITADLEEIHAGLGDHTPDREIVRAWERLVREHDLISDLLYLRSPMYQ